MRENKETLIRKLQALDFNDLVDVVHSALEPRNERRADAETGLPDRQLFLLSEVSYDKTSAPTDVTVYICAVGSSLELTPTAPGHTGRCRSCGTLLTSSCKRATCPVCDLENVGLT